MRKWQQQFSIGLLHSGFAFTFRFTELFRLGARRNDHLQPVQDARKEGIDYKRRNRREE
jgi:hypothetical protein